jgi:hypothetical protein
VTLTLGSRSRSNIRSGGAAVYIAEAGEISEQSSFGVSISLSNFNTLLANFSYLGELAENPEIESSPITVDLITAIGEFGKRHWQHRVQAVFTVLEVDNTIFNALLAEAEDIDALHDFLLVRNASAGQYVNYLRNVPWAMGHRKSHDWTDPEEVSILVDVTTKVLKRVTGQFLLS